jgi:hypothetical protein
MAISSLQFKLNMDLARVASLIGALVQLGHHIIIKTVAIKWPPGYLEENVLKINL